MKNTGTELIGANIALISVVALGYMVIRFTDPNSTTHLILGITITLTLLVLSTTVIRTALKHHKENKANN